MHCRILAIVLFSQFPLNGLRTFRCLFFINIDSSSTLMKIWYWDWVKLFFRPLVFMFVMIMYFDISIYVYIYNLYTFSYSQNAIHFCTERGIVAYVLRKFMCTNIFFFWKLFDPQWTSKIQAKYSLWLWKVLFSGTGVYVHSIAIMLDIILYIYTFCTKRENFVLGTFLCPLLDKM